MRSKTGSFSVLEHFNSWALEHLLSYELQAFFAQANVILTTDGY